MEKEKPVTKKVQIGKAFEVEVKKRNPEENEFVKINVKNIRIEENRSTDERINQEKDFVLLDVSIENRGDTESGMFTLSGGSFEFYDENGKEVDSYSISGSDDATYEMAKLRPGGKNEGTIVLSIPKGSTIKEMIYYTELSHLDSDQYVFSIE